MAGAYDPQVAQWFAAVDVDRSGKITATELQSALMSSNGRQFSESACRLMIGLFDQSGSGSIDINGFTHLYGYINQWLEAFRRYDQNGSGFVDQNELNQAFTTMGYRFSQPFVDFLHTKFGEQGQGVPVDGFIMACILIHKLTEGFRKKDSTQQGATTATRPTLSSGQKQSSVDLPEGGSPPPRKLSRSQSITSSTIPAHIALPPEMESQWRKRRESLEKLQLDKSQKSPWVLMHDFSENDPERQRLEQLRQQFSKRRQSIEKLQLDPRGPEVKPWMLLHNFDGDSEEPTSENPQ